MQILLDMTKPWLGKVGALFIQKEDASFRHTLFFFVRLQQVTELLTQAKFFNDVTVTFDVTALQVVQQRTTFTYQHCQSSFSAIIFSVELKVLSQVRNTV